MAKVSAGKKSLKKRALGAVFNRRNAFWAFYIAVGADLFGHSGDYGAKIMNNTGLRSVASWYCVAGIPLSASWRGTKSLAIDLNGIVQSNSLKTRRTTSQSTSTYCSVHILP